MSEEYTKQPVDRRHFLKAAAVTAVVATAAGAGAALLKSRAALPSVAPVMPPVVQTIADGSEQIAGLLAQLAAAQAENSRLQTELSAAQRQLAAQATGATDTAVQAMSVELEAANKQVGLLAGLVALYEQLDAVDVTDWVEEGIDTVTAAITELVDDLPSLNEGVAIGRQALAELDAHIPLLENGRSWLTHQTDRLHDYFAGVEALLETAVEQAAPFLQMFSEWVQNILKWLPFGLGQRTSAIMEAITTLLLETPATISGLQTNVAEPLDVWLGSGSGAVPLRQNLVKPLQEQVLIKATHVAEKTSRIQAIYRENVARPVGTAVINRRQIRALITAYRQQSQF